MGLWHPPPVNPLSTAASWNRPLELAWDSFLEGSIPVGCVITNATAMIVSEGRNRVASEHGGDSGLHATYIAHAEVNALASLSPGEYGDHTIWTTLEPCFMCSGAIVHSHVGVVRFAAADPLIEGADRMPELNAWVAARWPERHGPESGSLGDFASLLHLVWHHRRNPDGTVMGFHRTTNPGIEPAVATASALLKSPPDDWRHAAHILGFDLP